MDAGRRSVGTPNDVARSVERWKSAGADQLIYGVLNNTLPLEVAQESIETFGREVIPAFDSDPIHSVVLAVVDRVEMMDGSVLDGTQRR